MPFGKRSRVAPKLRDLRVASAGLAVALVCCRLPLGSEPGEHQAVALVIVLVIVFGLIESLGWKYWGYDLLPQILLRLRLRLFG